MDPANPLESESKLAILPLAILLGLLLLIPSNLAYAKAPQPTLAVLSPAGLFNPGSLVPQSFVVAFAVTNFEIVQPGLVNQTNTPNQGQVLVFLDDNFYGGWTTANPIPFYNLRPGNHTIMLQLVNNDYSALNPDVAQTITVTVQASPPIFNFQSILQAAENATSSANAAKNAAIAAGSAATAAKASADSANAALSSLASTVQSSSNSVQSSINSVQSSINSSLTYTIVAIAATVLTLLLVVYLVARKR